MSSFVERRVAGGEPPRANCGGQTAAGRRRVAAPKQRAKWKLKSKFISRLECSFYNLIAGAIIDRPAGSARALDALKICFVCSNISHYLNYICFIKTGERCSPLLYVYGIFNCRVCRRHISRRLRHIAYRRNISQIPQEFISPLTSHPNNAQSDILT